MFSIGRDCTSTSNCHKLYKRTNCKLLIEVFLMWFLPQLRLGFHSGSWSNFWTQTFFFWVLELKYDLVASETVAGQGWRSPFHYFTSSNSIQQEVNLIWEVLRMVLRKIIGASKWVLWKLWKFEIEYKSWEWMSPCVDPYICRKAKMGFLLYRPSPPSALAVWVFLLLIHLGRH